MDNIKSTVLSNFTWKWAERTVIQAVQFVVQIILARMISPDEYGIVAIAAVFISYANLFVQQGLNVAIIQKETLNEEDYPTSIAINLVVSTVLYIIIYLASPQIAEYYSNSDITPTLRLLALIVPLTAYNAIQNAYVARNMLFRKLFLSSLLSSILSGIIGIYLALNGYGIGALVVQQIANAAITTVSLQVLLKFKCKIILSRKSAVDMIPFGAKVLGASIIALTTEKFYTLFIGKKYNSETLAYFDRGHQFPNVIIGNINSSIMSIVLPVYSQYQNDAKQLKQLVSQTVRLSTYVITPFVVGLALLAKPIIILLLTDNWLQAVPFLQIECVYYLTIPIMSIFVQCLKAVKLSGAVLALEICKLILTILLFMILSGVNIYIFVGMRSVISMAIVLISLFVLKKRGVYCCSTFCHDIWKPVLACAAMSVSVYIVMMIVESVIIEIALSCLVGIAVYVLFSRILAITEYTYVKRFLTNLFSSIWQGRRKNN